MFLLGWTYKRNITAVNIHMHKVYQSATRASPRKQQGNWVITSTKDIMLAADRLDPVVQLGVWRLRLAGSIVAHGPEQVKFAFLLAIVYDGGKWSQQLATDLKWMRRFSPSLCDLPSEGSHTSFWSPWILQMKDPIKWKKAVRVAIHNSLGKTQDDRHL